MSLYPASYYAASATLPALRPPLVGDVQADVAIVGGGYSGLSAAIELAERGYSVRLIDAARVGWGASGRNGGQLLPGFSAHIDKVAQSQGIAAARQMWDMSVEAVKLVTDRISRYGIDCDLERGHAVTAIKPRHIEELKRDLDQMTGSLGYHDAEYWDAAKLHSVVDSKRYIGALFDRGAYHLHPLKLAIGLADAAGRAGAILHDQTKMVRLEHGPKPRVVTENGSIEARFVLLGGNAYLAGQVRELDGLLMPVASIIVATEQLGDRLTSVYREPIAIADANFILDYFRPSADGRILFGGRANYDGQLPSNIGDEMAPRLARVFPSLAGTKLEYAWGGLIGISLNRLPQLGRIASNVYYAQGYSGHGVALANFAGKLVAETIAGQAERFDLFAAVQHRKFPGGTRFRTPLLVLAMLYYKLMDAR